MKRLLLVGGTGFVGSHIVNFYADDYVVLPTGQEYDVTSINKTRELVRNFKPDYVVNLASITSLKDAFENPLLTKKVNFYGNKNLLSALRESKFTGTFLYISSSEVYGNFSNKSLPLSENVDLNPINPYADAKAASEALCEALSQTEKFKIIIARPFNHIGSGQSDRFALPDFARQIVKIKLGLSEPTISVGNIDLTRDFLDVRDVAAAYIRLLNFGEQGQVYNVCSGVDRSIRSLIENMCSLADISVQLIVDPKRLRNVEQVRICGDNQKLIQATGWHQKYSIDETLSDILDDWETRLGASNIAS